jgi:Zn-dependent protease
MLNWVIQKLLILPGILVGLSVHEFGHAKMAQLCGDDTAYYQGRVSLNPKDHIDVLGLMSLFMLGFGWGRPVMINPRNFKKPRRDSIFVGLAGVCMNFITALLFAFILSFIVQLAPGFVATRVGDTLTDVIIQTVIINISLMLFNLLPIPPLDGFGVLSELINLPRRNYNLYVFLVRYGYYILLALIIFGTTSRILNVPFSAMYRLIMKIAFIGV